VRERSWSAYPHAAASERPLLAGLLADLGSYLPSILIRQDKSTMLHSVETRVPFLDPAMVALALNMPLPARVEPKRKGILRDLCDRHLPPEIARRPKVGFGFNVRRCIDPAARSEFLEDGVLRDLLEAPAEPWKHAAAGASGSQVLWFWTSEIWCRLFLEGQSPDTVAEAMWRDDPAAPVAERTRPAAAARAA
jgi:asparagine synthetase B (glutamine-hydrolysing)